MTTQTAPAQGYSIHDLFSTVPCGCSASIAQRAYQGISFDPERRAQSELKDTQQDIESLFNSFRVYLTPENKDEAFEAFIQYCRSYKSKYNAYLYAKSCCVSWMIAGASGYNVARESKKFDRERRLYDLFSQWRSRAFDSMLKKVFGSYAVNGIILSDDPDALHLLRSKLDALEQKQETMKQLNKLFKGFDKTKSIGDFFEAAGIENEAQQKSIRLNIASWDARPYPGYKLTNNNAKIKATKERIARLEKYQELQTKKIKIGDVTICQNVELVRLQIFFPGKPDSETISDLKRHGFRWSPSQGAWQRQDTNRAHYEARNIVCGYNDRQGEK